MDNEDTSRVRESTWTGSEEDRREQGICLPPTGPPLSLPQFQILVGTACSIKRLSGNNWKPYTTKKALGFERYERYIRCSYEFRFQGWLLLVHRRDVVHREDLYRCGM